MAFVVGEYDFVETNDSNGVSMKVYTPVGKKEHGQFALDVMYRFELVCIFNEVWCLFRLELKFYHFMLIISILNTQLQKLIKLPSQILLWGKKTGRNRNYRKFIFLLLVPWKTGA